MTKILDMPLAGDVLDYSGQKNHGIVQGTFVYASGTATCVSCVATNTITINGLVYTGVTGVKSDNTEFSVDTGDNETAADLADSITKDSRTGIDVPSFGVTATAAANVVTITANKYGVLGNSITMSENSTTITLSGVNLTGGATAELYTTGVNEESDGAFDFDNTNYIKLTNSLPLNFEITDPFSVTFWAKLTNQGTSDIIIGNNDVTSVNDGWNIYRAGTNVFAFTIKSSGASNTQVVTGTVVDDVWYHVAVTKSSVANRSGMKIYLNGVLVSTGTNLAMSGTMKNSNVPVIGAETDGDFTTTGQIAKVEVWNSELPATYIRDHYHQGIEFADDNKGNIPKLNQKTSFVGTGQQITNLLTTPHAGQKAYSTETDANFVKDKWFFRNAQNSDWIKPVINSNEIILGQIVGNSGGMPPGQRTYTYITLPTTYKFYICTRIDVVDSATTSSAMVGMDLVESETPFTNSDSDSTQLVVITPVITTGSGGGNILTIIPSSRMIPGGTLLGVWHSGDSSNGLRSIVADPVDAEVKWPYTHTNEPKFADQTPWIAAQPTTDRLSFEAYFTGYS